jgi:hypothetical protein
MQFPIRHAAPALRGKPPQELPHGFLAAPPEVRQLVAEQRAKYPRMSASYELWMLNYGTLDFYFEGVGQEVLYRETPDGPVIVAVGYDEARAFERRLSSEERKEFKHYSGYSEFISLHEPDPPQEDPASMT